MQLARGTDTAQVAHNWEPHTQPYSDVSCAFFLRSMEGRKILPFFAPVLSLSRHPLCSFPVGTNAKSFQHTSLHTCCAASVVHAGTSKPEGIPPWSSSICHSDTSLLHSGVYNSTCPCWKEVSRLHPEDGDNVCASTFVKGALLAISPERWGKRKGELWGLGCASHFQ